MDVCCEHLGITPETVDYSDNTAHNVHAHLMLKRYTLRELLSQSKRFCRVLLGSEDADIDYAIQCVNTLNLSSRDLFVISPYGDEKRSELLQLMNAIESDVDEEEDTTVDVFGAAAATVPLLPVTPPPVAAEEDDGVDIEEPPVVQRGGYTPSAAARETSLSLEIHDEGVVLTTDVNGAVTFTSSPRSTSSISNGNARYPLNTSAEPLARKSKSNNTSSNNTSSKPDTLKYTEPVVYEQKDDNGEVVRADIVDVVSEVPLYVPPKQKFSKAKNAVNVIQTFNGPAEYVLHTFSQRNHLAPESSCWYRRVNHYYEPIFNWVQVGAVWKPGANSRNGLLVLSMCALHHREHGHTHIALRVCVSMCNTPITGVYVLKLSELNNPNNTQFEGVELWKEGGE